MKKDVEKQELTICENNTEKTVSKKTKSVKNISVKKLPKMFRKKYTEKKFNKKIAKNIYIAKDKEFVTSLFVTEEKGKRKLLSIPSETKLSKQDAAKLKLIAKQIKKQRGRVKWGSLLICLAIIVILVAAIIFFKDKILKKGMQIGLESAFGAKCDIAYLHLDISDSNLRVKGLEVADKKDTMTNLFEVGSIEMDFNLNQLLKKRFVAEKLEVADVLTGTPRTTDGALPLKPEKQKKKEKEPSEFQLKMKDFTQKKTNLVKNSISNLFAQYNPETLLTNFQSQLSSPDISKQVEEELTVLLSEWNEIPNPLTASVNKTVNETKSALEFNWESVKSDPKKLKDGIELVSSAIKNVEKLKSETTDTVSKIKVDAKQVQNLSDKVNKAVKNDYNFVSNQINNIASFSIKEDGLQFITSTFNNVLADLLGKYYPMLQDGIAYASKFSNTISKYIPASDNKEEEKEEKPKIERYKGRTIEYKQDKVPSFLIQKVHGSGVAQKYGLDFVIEDISNDMDKWGKPATIKASLLHDTMSDSMTGTLDLRSNRSGNMIDLTYNGSGYGVNFSLPEEQPVEGIPSAAGTGSFSAKLGANEDGSFNVNGSILLNPVTLSAANFEPAYAFDLYSKALNKFDSLNAAVDIAYSDNSGLDMDISSEIDRQFAQILTKLFNEELSVIKDKATVKLKDSLDNVTAGLTDKFAGFDDIKSKIEEQSNKIDTLKAQLEQKKKDIENQLKSYTDSAVQQATDSAKQKVDSVVDNAKDSAKDALKGLLGR